VAVWQRGALGGLRRVGDRSRRRRCRPGVGGARAWAARPGHTSACAVGVARPRGRAVRPASRGPARRDRARVASGLAPDGAGGCGCTRRGSATRLRRSRRDAPLARAHLGADRARAAGGARVPRAADGPPRGASRGDGRPRPGRIRHRGTRAFRAAALRLHTRGEREAVRPVRQQESLRRLPRHGDTAGSGPDSDPHRARQGARSVQGLGREARGDAGRPRGRGRDRDGLRGAHGAVARRRPQPGRGSRRLLRGAALPGAAGERSCHARALGRARHDHAGGCVARDRASREGTPAHQGVRRDAARQLRLVPPRWRRGGSSGSALRSLSSRPPDAARGSPCGTGRGRRIAVSRSEPWPGSWRWRSTASWIST